MDALAVGVDRHPVVAALTVFLLNLALKLPTMGQQSLWVDEAASLVWGKGELDLGGYLANDHTPLYYLLLRPWLSIFGPTIESARALSVVLSSATGALLLLFARRFFDARTAIFAAGLFTVSRFQFYFAQEARSYALLGLLVVVSFYLLLLLLESPSKRRMIALGVVNALVLYAHYVAVFVLAAQLVAALALSRGRSSRLSSCLQSLMLTFALFLPYLVFAALHWPPKHSAWIPPPSLGEVRYVLKQLSGSTHLLIAFAAIVLVVGTVGRSRKVEQEPREVVLWLWAFLPVLLGFAAAHIVPLFIPRYFLYASIGLFLLMARLVRVSRLSAGVQATVAILLCLVALAGTLRDPHQRHDWRSVVRMVGAESGGRSLVVISPKIQALPFAYYSSPDRFQAADPQRPHDLIGEEALVLEDARELAERPGWATVRVIIVATDYAPASPEALLPWMEARGHRLVRGERFSGVSVLVFDPPTGGAPALHLSTTPRAR